MLRSDTATATVNKRRSERVVLIVRLVLSVKGPDGRITNQEAKTQVVNAHGGLLVTQMDMATGQEFVLTNPKTGVAQACRAIRCERLDVAALSVAFQFNAPSPKFWPIDFPPSDWTAANDV
jgi:hypothetical protein